MSLYLTPLYKDAVQQFTTVTSDLQFQEAFVYAVNKALDALSDAGDLSSAITHINSYNDPVSELDNSDTYILMAGIVFYLVMAGREHVLRDNAYSILKGEWEQAKGQYMVNESHDAQDSIADNLSGEDADIIGLGDVTTIDRIADTE